MNSKQRWRDGFTDKSKARVVLCQSQWLGGYAILMQPLRLVLSEGA